MTIMAIDASTKSSGIAIFSNNKLIHYDCLTATSTDLIIRIKKIVEALKAVLDKYEVEKIILEEVRPENGIKNIQTHRALMWLQAAIAFMIHESYSKIKIEYVYPSEWRSACGIKSGRGMKRALAKAADIEFVKNTYNITVNDDIADAIGIGHAYVNKISNEINWD